MVENFVSILNKKSGYPFKISGCKICKERKSITFFVFSFQLLLNTQEVVLSEASIFQVTDLMPEHIHS